MNIDDMIVEDEYREHVTHDHAVDELEFSNMIAMLNPDKIREDGDTVSAITITFQVTEDCNLKCSYCYQTCKSKNKMSIETAKKAIDMILTDEKYCKVNIKQGCIIEFIGGEPFLEIDLIEEIYRYFIRRCIELNHHWLHFHRISICSNGLLYFTDKVQRFIEKYHQTLSLTVSIDGPKELHDACRVNHNNEGSYDAASKAAHDLQTRFGLKTTKATLAPENIMYIGDIIKHFTTEFNFSVIHGNCIYEHEWTKDECLVIFDELIKLSDYIHDNDLYSKVYISLFNENEFTPINYDLPENDKNWCGGCGDMISLDYQGKFYPCIRYMKSSLGTSREPIIIGDVENGIMATESQCATCKMLWSVTAKSQSSEKCISCPVARGCSWCSAYNYQTTGTVNRRVTTICLAHKTRALANVYYWNLFYNSRNIPVVYENFLPEDESIELIGKERYEKIVEIMNKQRELEGKE